MKRKKPFITQEWDGILQECFQENYFKELMLKHEYPLNAMAHAIFDKYNINDFQGDLFKKKNKPNPVFFNELKNLLSHFNWNWEDYLEKNKLNF